MSVIFSCAAMHLHKKLREKQSSFLCLSCFIYLLGLDILARPSGVLHLYTYTTPVLHLLTPINFLVWVENITCFLT